jgi:cytochrome c-type biogenesis protein CcmH/NrfG
VSASLEVDLELMRAAAALDTDPAAAARRLTAVLDARPAHAEARFMLAEACRRLGDATAAERLFESLVDAHPESALLQLELGRTRLRAGAAQAALPALRRAVELDPEFADAWLELARASFALEDSAAGDRAFAAYTRYAPEVAALRGPRDALYEGRTAEAEALLRRCLALAPGDAAARGSLAQLLFERHQHAEVLPLVERLLLTAPDALPHLGLKAMSLALSARTDEALATMEAAVALHRDDPSAWIQFGHLLRILALPARAVAAFRRALELDPGAAVAYWALADLKTFRFDDADVTAMESLLARLPSPDPGRVYVEFALGKARSDRRDYAASFAHYARGNALKRATIPYDAAQITAGTLASKALYTRSFFDARAGWGSRRRDPIFVVGLPRSGSTLVEQILASHSAVEGTRELTDLRDIAFEIAVEAAERAGVDYPAVLATLGAERIAAAAERYLATTATQRRRAAPRFIDKMPVNFSHIGLIQLMFPEASIIDARRHPLACGLSCYRELFADSNEFSYDLGELGLYYRDYADLMDHVDAVLPGRVHRVHYERLVTDPEGEVRRLLDYCGLAFEASCLRFYENPRIVLTVSAEQVRLPIYTDALEEWRHYEPWLGPLKSALGDLVGRYPRGAARAGVDPMR